MIDMSGNGRIDKETIQKDLVAIVDDMTRDWDTDGDDAIGPNTRLIRDLEFESIDVVQFVVAIEQHYQRSTLPFEKLLMKDGRYVDELVLADAVDFLYRYLDTTGP